MPRTGDYSLGKIYKLVSNQTDNVYIGSTCQKLLSMRFGSHKSDYKCWTNGKEHYRTSYEIVKYEDAQIILIENYPCVDKNELEARERYHIQNTKNCVNKYIPTRSTKEWIDEHKEHVKEIQKQNRDHRREYYLEYDKNRYKDERKERLLQWSKQRVVCECGFEGCRGNLTRHLKTDKHKQLLEQKAISEPDPELNL